MQGPTPPLIATGGPSSACSTMMTGDRYAATSTAALCGTCSHREVLESSLRQGSAHLATEHPNTTYFKKPDPGHHAATHKSCLGKQPERATVSGGAANIARHLLNYPCNS